MGPKLDIQKLAESLRSKIKDRDDILAIIDDLETSWNTGDREGVKKLSEMLYADISKDIITKAQRVNLKDMMDGKSKPERSKKPPTTPDQTNQEGPCDNDEMKIKATNSTEVGGVKESVTRMEYLLSISIETSADKELKKLESETQKEINELKEEKVRLKTDLEKAKKSADKAFKKLEKEAEYEIDKLKEENKRLLAHLKEAEKRVDHLQSEMNRNNLKLERSESFLQESQERNDELSTRIDKLQSEMDRNNLKLERSESFLQESQERNDELSTWLNKAVGDMLTHNNPNIADLSDGNRPTKLAERYSELYDNEWTDAYEILEKLPNRKVEENVSILRKILLDCYDVCMKTADVQMQHIKSLFLHPPTNGEIGDGKEEFKFSEGQENMLSSLRKETADQSHKALVKVILKKHREEAKSDQMKKFIKTCTDLCWKMAIQTPPVFIDTMDRRDKLFDNNMFKAYTRFGKYVDFVVWPPLYLHENGSRLSKGIAQGKKGKGK